MIFDHLSNILIYKGISPDISAALTYLHQLSPDIAPDTYQLSPRVKAIVSEYETKVKNEVGYEAHRKNIDIQYLLKGEERIACLPIEKLKETTPYSEEKDAAFYTASIQPQEMTIGGGYFAIFFPQDGHMPQLSVSEPMMVKKVVVKVEIIK
ncbi:MAG: YhcH/YjgK/YiaL family protein [Bacteroidales bacterium]|nr:YhcH/YjgK/YiaL family protein [Bacteroidales bacterium]